MIIRLFKILLVGILAIFLLVVVRVFLTTHKTPEVVTEGSILQETILFDERARDYLLYVPKNLSEKPALVFVLHGGYGWPNNVRDNTDYQFEQLAEEHGFLVVYPAGTRERTTVGGHWNDGRVNEEYQAYAKNVDDVGFISALIDRLSKEYQADTRRVYVTGISNGGAMSMRIGCELEDKVTAIAPVIGPFPITTAEDCELSRPLPVLLMYGTLDNLVRWDTNYVHGGVRLNKLLGEKLTIPETLSKWLSLNECSEDLTTESLPDIADDETTVVRDTYSSCASGAEVVFYAIVGGGHTWPQGNSSGSERLVGKETQDINGGEEIWKFFERFTL